ERELAERAASYAQRLHAVASTLSRALSPTDVIDAILREAIPAVGASSGAVLKRVDVPGEPPEYRYLAGVGIIPEVELKYRQISADIDRPAGDAWRTRRPVFIPDLATWNARYSTPPTSARPGRRPREGAWAAVPLEATGRMFGTLTLAFASEREFPEEDRAFISTVAQHCAQALERGELYEKAIAANRAKTDFLAVMSHELRTPLTAILGYTELVADEIVGPVTQIQRDHLLRANAAGRHLLGIIEGLLTFASLEAGREQARVEGFALGELVGELVSLMEPLARKKNLALIAECASPTALLVTDRQKARQILLNLLSNAVKFTTQGQVVLQAAVQDTLATISVSDTGPGIAPENLHKVFDTFWQADQSLTRETGGTGLGLGIARHLARVLGGDITVTSALGEGSTFSVRFPVRLPSTELA
ncbi:MAG TPA: ATP-binding protein, partial [Longimicrobiales bacterium]